MARLASTPQVPSGNPYAAVGFGMSDAAKARLVRGDGRRSRRTERLDSRTAAQLERDREEKSAQLKRWRHQRRAEREKLLNSRHGDAARDLIDFMKAMRPSDGDALIERVARGPWIAADRDTRFWILVALDEGIGRLRASLGLEPADDPLPGEPASVFLKLREMLPC
jgi:hypothetical protein